MEQIMVRVKKNYLIIHDDEIDWIGSERNYIRIYRGKKTFLIRHTLKDIEKRMDADKFIRINRSVIVNKNRIKELRADRNSNYSVILNNGDSLLWSCRFQDKLEKFLSKYMILNG